MLLLPSQYAAAPLRDLLHEAGRGRIATDRRSWLDALDNPTPAAGQQFEYGFDDIGNRRYARSGGDAGGGSLREQTYTANTMDQSTQRTVPGYAAVSGRANPAATVTVNNQPTIRHGLDGAWFFGERPVKNSTGAVVQGITNVAAFQRPACPTS